jgi:hypothetical protein
MSWDYGLYHKFRFYFLDLNLDDYETTEIGRHLRRKNDDVSRYTDDMTKTFQQLSESTTEDGTIAMVNAPSIVRGESVDTNEILANCAQRAGWHLVDTRETIDIPGPHHGMYASLSPRGASAPGQAGKREFVLVFKRA